MPAGGRGAHSPAEPRGSHQTPNPLELLSSYFNKPSRGLAPYLNKLSRQLAFFYPPRHSSLSTSHANKSPPQQLPRGGAAHPSTQGAAPTESLRRGGCAGPKARADSAGSLRPHPSPRRSAIAQSQWPAPSGEPAGHAQRVFMAIPKSPSTTACAAGTPLTASSEGLAQRSLWPRLCLPSQASGAGSTQRGGQGARALPEAQASAPVP